MPTAFVTGGSGFIGRALIRRLAGEGRTVPAPPGPDSAARAVVVRPRLVWGPGDTSVLPAVVEVIEAGRFRWIGGGRQLTATTHIDNTVEGLVLGATRGKPGGVYFVTDGEPAVFRDFMTRLVGTRGVEPPDGEVPLGVARAVAATAETTWRTLRLRDRPPLTRFAVWASALE